MLIFLYLLCIILNFLEIVFDKKIKRLALFSWVLVLVAMIGNNQNADYQNYEYVYNSGGNPLNMETGYIMLSNFFKSLGFSYSTFLCFIFLICFLMIFISFREYKAYMRYIAPFYMTYLIFYNIIQVRDMIMVCLYTSALILLVKRRNFLYSAVVILASFFHRAAIMLLILAFIKPRNKTAKTIMKFEILIIIFICIAIFLNGNRLPFASVIISLFGSFLEGKAGYLLSVTRWGFLYFFAIHFFNIFLAVKSSQYIKRFSHDKNLYELADVIYMAVIASSFSMPLTMLEGQFARYIRMNDIAIYILLSAVITIYFKRFKKRNFIERAVAGFYMPFYVYIAAIDLLRWFMRSLESENSIVVQILKHNFLLH